MTVLTARSHPCNKHFLAVFLLVLALLSFGCPDVAAQAVDLPKAADLPGHPRLLLLKNQEQGIQKTIRQDTTFRKVHALILAESEAMLTLPLSKRELIGVRLLHISGETLRRVFFLSYAWRLTQQKKFLDRAELELLTVSQFTDWNPTHFLDVAEMTMAVAIGYDWLHAALPASTLATLKNAIVTKGLEPSLKPEYSSWVKRNNNWNQVCHAGLTFGALAVYEDHPQLAQGIIQRAVQSVPVAMKEYAPNGGYPEGYAYWGYGTTFNVLLLDALEKAFKTDFGLTSLPGFLNTGNFLLHMVGPSGKNFNYGDGNEGVGLNPAMFWLAQRQKSASMLFTEKQFLAGPLARFSKDRVLPAVMIWAAGLKAGGNSVPQDLVWVGNGTMPVALLRTSWTDKNALFVGFKGGSPFTSHAQMDVGAFVMDALGERWAMDLGRQSYESLESKGVSLWDKKQHGQRWKILKNMNHFHNTLTFNDSLQRVSGHAPFTGYSDNPAFLSVVADLSTVYDGQVASANRGIALVNQQFVLVRDEVATGQNAATLRWSLVTPAKVTLATNGTAVLTLNGKKLVLQAQGPTPITFKTWSTDPIESYDAPNPGTVVVGFETPLPAHTKGHFTVLLLPENTAPKPGIEKLALKDWKLKK